MIHKKVSFHFPKRSSDFAPIFAPRADHRFAKVGPADYPFPGGGSNLLKSCRPPYLCLVPPGEIFSFFCFFWVLFARPRAAAPTRPRPCPPSRLARRRLRRARGPGRTRARRRGGGRRGDAGRGRPGDAGAHTRCSVFGARWLSNRELTLSVSRAARARSSDASSTSRSRERLSTTP